MENKKVTPEKSLLSPQALDNAAEEETDTMYDLDICSATDCTGLIPAMPASGSEITSYEQLYHFLPRAKG